MERIKDGKEIGSARLSAKGAIEGFVFFFLKKKKNLLVSLWETNNAVL